MTVVGICCLVAILAVLSHRGVSPSGPPPQSIQSDAPIAALAETASDPELEYLELLLDYLPCERVSAIWTGQDVIAAYGRTENPRCKRVFLSTLGRIGDREVIPFLMRLLDDEDELIRRFAQSSIGAIERRAARAPP